MLAARFRRSSSSLRIRRFLVSVPLSLSLVGGSLVATAAPAEAASYVWGCFRSSNPSYNINGAVPVQLQAYSGGVWVTVATMQISHAGCVAWNIAPSLRPYYLRLLVNYQAFGARWYGTSPLWATPGDGVAVLGTGLVTCYGCVYN